MASIRKRPNPRFYAPQPDRDFPQGSRPTDRQASSASALGSLGQMGGGSAGMFRPRQLKKPRPIQQQPQPQQRSAQPAGGVKIQFSGDPTQLAQTFQGLVNSTGAQAGQVQTMGGNPGQDFVAPIAGGIQEALQPTPVVPPPAVPQPQVVAPPGPQPQPLLTQQPGPPAAAPNFGELQGYIDAIGGLDFIAEDAYSPYAGWQPQLPQMFQAKNALDQQFLATVGSAGINQEVAKSFAQAALARAVQDEMFDQETNKEAMAGRGLFRSGITTENSRDIKRDYLRGAEDTFADLVSGLTEGATGLQAGHGSYLDKLIELANQEAGILVDTPGAGSPSAKEEAGPDKTSGGGKNGGKSKKKGTVGKNRTRPLPQEARDHPHRWLKEHPEWAKNHPQWAKKLKNKKKGG
jgi:hypothetical protein